MYATLFTRMHVSFDTLLLHLVDVAHGYLTADGAARILTYRASGCTHQKYFVTCSPFHSLSCTLLVDCLQNANKIYHAGNLSVALFEHDIILSTCPDSLK